MFRYGFRTRAMDFAQQLILLMIWQYFLAGNIIWKVGI